MRIKLLAVTIAVLTAGIAFHFSPGANAGTASKAAGSNQNPCQGSVRANIDEAKLAFRDACGQEWNDQLRHQCSWTSKPSNGWICHEFAPSGIKPPLTDTGVQTNTPPSVAAEAGTPKVVSAPAELTTEAKRSSVSKYWTPERMQQAQPLEANELDLQAKARPEQPPTSRTPATQPDRPAQVDSRAVTGKIYFTKPDGSHSYCSASVVNTPGKDSVWTAGHCLYNYAAGAWNSNIAFTPSADVKDPGNTAFEITGTDGASSAAGAASAVPPPRGVWEAKRSYALRGWVSDHDYKDDIGVIILQPKDGKHIVDVVGGAGLYLNPPETLTVSAYGYPYWRSDDESVRVNEWTLQTCTNRTANRGPGFAMEGHFEIDCPVMGGGASGGPWHTTVNGRSGYLTGIHTRSDKGRGWSPFFGAGAKALRSATGDL